MRPEISKSTLSSSRLHKLHAFMENNFGTEMCIKFESEEISITGDYCSKSDSKGEDRRKGTVLRRCGDCTFSASFVREPY